MKTIDADAILARATPPVHQQGHEIQPFNGSHQDAHRISGCDCAESVENLNQLLADTITLRDLYKKHHWQVSGPTFYQLHLLFDKHYDEQNELVDVIAERIQVLGGVSVAMAQDVAEMTLIPRPPRGAKKFRCRFAAVARARDRAQGGAHDGAARCERGDDGTNDLLVSDVIRRNELHAWFVAEHVVNIPLTHAT